MRCYNYSSEMSRNEIINVKCNFENAIDSIFMLIFFRNGFGITFQNEAII